jgi:hypothetical protein
MAVKGPRVEVMREDNRSPDEREPPLHALYYTDMVQAQEPVSTAALEIKLGAMEQLLAASGRENFSEVRWLEAEIHENQARLA